MLAMTTLPPGFRFHPTDVELVWYYLKRRVMGRPINLQVIAEVDLYKFAPWDLPDKSFLQSRDLEWYFFCPRDRKYANGSRKNRATDIGFWKTTGKDRAVVHNSRTIGVKKSLVFHLGRAPHGGRTDWVMYEYRLDDKELSDSGVLQDTFVLCKIFKKSGPGPKTGEQYGAPFNEDDWEDGVINQHSVSMTCVSTPSVRPLGGDQAILLEPALHQPIASGINEAPSTPALCYLDDELLTQLEEALMISASEDANTEMSGAVVPNENVDEVSVVDTEAIYNGLGDLSSQTQQKPLDSLDFSDTMASEYGWQSMLSELQSDQYLEMGDIPFLLPTDLSDIPTVETAAHTAPVVSDSLHEGPHYADTCPTTVLEMDGYVDQNGWLTEADFPQMTAPVCNPEPTETVFPDQLAEYGSPDPLFPHPTNSYYPPPS